MTGGPPYADEPVLCARACSVASASAGDGKFVVKLDTGGGLDLIVKLDPGYTVTGMCGAAGRLGGFPLCSASED